MPTKKCKLEKIKENFLSLRIDNNKLTEKCKFPLAIILKRAIMLSMREKCFFSQVKVKNFTYYMSSDWRAFNGR
jgi:hypothetical protein